MHVKVRVKVTLTVRVKVNVMARAQMRVKVSEKVRLKLKTRNKKEVMEVTEGVDRVFTNIYYLISGVHIGPGFDELLNYLLFAVF